MGALTVLNESGDVTLIWNEENDDAMTELIEKKMKEGFTFFIVEPRFFGLISPKKTPLADASDARKHRALAVRDEDFIAIVEGGAASLVKTPEAPVKKSRISRDAKEVAKAESVATRPLRGG